MSARQPAPLSLFGWMRGERAQQGQSLVQLLIAVVVMMILAGIAVPNINQAIAAERLRTSAGDLASLMQRTRLLATRNDAAYPILFGVDVNGVPIAFADLNGNGVWDVATEPVMYFSPRVFQAAGPPPAPYVLVGDTGGSFPTGTTLGYSGRGLPCAYVVGAPPTCTTPAAQYFTFYITDNRANPGWAAVIVTKGGRSKVAIWRGTAWGM